MLYFAHSFISDHVAIDNYYCKTLIGPKPLRIRFDKTDGFIRIYDGTRYLVLFGPEKYYAIYNRIRFLISVKGSITYFFLKLFCKNQS